MRMLQRLYWRYFPRKTWRRTALVVALIVIVLCYLFLGRSTSTEQRILSSDVLHAAWLVDGVLELSRAGIVDLVIDMKHYNVHTSHMTCEVGHGNSKVGVYQEHCREWPTFGKIMLTQYQDGDATCINVTDQNYRKVGRAYPAAQHCIQLSNTHWFGGAPNVPETWPLNLAMKERAQASDSSGSYGSVHDRYWFSSHGYGVMVDDEVPLFVTGTDKKFCLKAYYDDKVYFLTKEITELKYTVCAKNNVKLIHTYMADRYFRKPIGYPDEKMIKFPVWSTWVKFKSMIDQSQTETYIKDIFNHAFPVSQLELDDIYTVNYGDYEFDPKKFPDPKRMIKLIHNYNVRLTVWTHPFSNRHTKSYAEGNLLGYFVKDATGQKTGVARWWRGGDAGVLDVTNSQAVEWFKKRLEKLRALGVDGHKYDAGEIGFLPSHFRTHKELTSPAFYSKYYAEAMYNITNKFMQVRVGYKTQHLPVFVSMMDRMSSWESALGLKSIIPTTLIFGSLGYIFVMPDMIGGNAYCQGNMDCTDYKPERELFIRWVQLTAFLPMMQFSITPWEYDKEVEEISRTYVNLHTFYVAPLIIELARAAVATGYPIIRPMWWLAPYDEEAFTADSQFLVGDSLLVAPVLEKGAKSRDIFFPIGVWLSKTTHHKIEVKEPGYMLRNFPVDLNNIPYFERLS